MISRARSALGALTALSALLILVVGLPIVLYRFGGSPLPAHVPGWPRIATFMSSRQDGTMLLALVRGCTWLAWLLFTACVLAEAQATISGRRFPRLRRLGGLQGAAAHLVALSALAFTAAPTVTLTASAAAASQSAQPGSRMPQRFSEKSAAFIRLQDRPGADVSQRSAPQAGEILAARAASLTVQDAETAAETQLVTVRAGDCLWSLADWYLGAGDRYSEIVKLNYGRDMGGGRVFRNPSLIQPGWQLLIPVSATLGPSQPLGVPHHLGHPTADHYYRHRHATATQHRAQSSPVRHQGGNGASAPTPNITGKAALPGNVPANGTAPMRFGPGPASFRTPANADQASSPTAGAAVFVVGALAGAVVANLDRLRRMQRERRRRGRRIPLPTDPDTLASEQRLRAAAVTERVETLRDALACLEACIRGTGQELPDIVGLHVTPDVLEVLLAAPAASSPPAPFVITPGRQGMCWQLGLPAVTTVPAGAVIATERRFAGLPCHMLPGVITAGATNSGYLLLDLESMQVLGCDGPQHLIDQFVATVATELATGQWSGWYDLILVGCDELADVGRAEHCATLGDALDLLAARTAIVAQRMAEGSPSDIRELRLAEPDNEDWGLTVLVSRVEPEAEQMARLLQLAEDGPGGIAALVAGDPESDDGRMAPTVMQLAPDPERPNGIIANVVPLQITVRPQTLSAAEYDAIGSLLATAADLVDIGGQEEPYVEYGAPPWIPHGTDLGPGPDVDSQPWVDDDGEPAETQPDQNWAVPSMLSSDRGSVREDGWDIALTSLSKHILVPGDSWGIEQRQAWADDCTPAGRRRPQDAPPERASTRLDIRILGPFAIIGAAEQLQPKHAELVLALALASPAGLSNSAICAVLGADPDHPKPADAVRQIITRTRRRLGLAADGQEYIIHAGKGQYMLHQDAALDWSRFRELVAAGRADDLRAALSLINGQPFTGSYFWWIDIPLAETVRAEIVDAAETLAEFEFAIGLPRAAAKAARAGLMAEPSAEQLWRIVMRAEHAAGNLAGVAEAWRRCLNAIEDIAPGGEPHPDTATLYQQLTDCSRQRAEAL